MVNASNYLFNHYLSSTAASTSRAMEPATHRGRLTPEQSHTEALQIGENVRLIFMISNCGIALLAKTLLCY